MEGFIICRWPEVPRNPFPPLMPTVHDCVSQTGRGISRPKAGKYRLPTTPQGQFETGPEGPELEG